MGNMMLLASCGLSGPGLNSPTIYVSPHFHIPEYFNLHHPYCKNLIRISWEFRTCFKPSYCLDFTIHFGFFKQHFGNWICLYHPVCIILMTPYEDLIMVLSKGSIWIWDFIPGDRKRFSFWNTVFIKTQYLKYQLFVLTYCCQKPYFHLMYQLNAHSIHAVTVTSLCFVMTVPSSGSTYQA